MQALLAQLASIPRDSWANARRAAEVLYDCPEADLAVFPELFLSAYVTDCVEAAARRSEGPELALVAEAARENETAVIIGFAEALTRGGVANSAACFERDGSLAGIYRKSQLFGTEMEAFERGCELLVLDLAGRRVAPLICFDIEFPELARALAVNGADLIATASANMEPFYVEHEVAVRARALENRVPHVYANAVGSAEGFHFVGGSRCVDANGVVVAEATHDRERLLLTIVGEAGTSDERVDYVQHLPGELEAIVR